MISLINVMVLVMEIVVFVKIIMISMLISFIVDVYCLSFFVSLLLRFNIVIEWVMINVSVKLIVFVRSKSWIFDYFMFVILFVY